MDMQSCIDAVLSKVKAEAKFKAEANGAMSGYKIVSELCNFDRNQKVIIRLFDNESDTYQDVESNFNCTSWRGSYDLPAISYEPVNHTSTSYTITEIINNINNSQGKEVTGYKGGEFTLSMNDIIYVANYGSSNNSTAIVDIIEENGLVVCITQTDMY